jgi:hypothetical protein
MHVEGFALEARRWDRPLDLAAAMRVARARHGLALLDQVRDILTLSLGCGRLEPREYYLYGLYDHARHDVEARGSFLGRVAAFKLGRGLVDRGLTAETLEKPRFERLMQAHGLPTTTTLACYGGERPPEGVRHLADEAALGRFLRESESRCLFGKPLASVNSLGVVAIDGWEPATDGVVLADGRRVTVLRMASALAPHSAGGYIFQRRLVPHPELAPVLGGAVSTVRVLVLRDRGAPLIHRCAWKIPARGNPADNFWRPGNLLAAVEPVSGRVWRVVDDIHPRQQALERHPDSGMALRDRVLPDWTSLRATVLAAAELLPGSRLLGFDVALTDEGPVLVEVEGNGGHPMLVQLAHDRGVIDAAFERFRARLALPAPARRAA